MELLITGGSGFIGRNLKAGLSREHTVFAPSHGELDLLDEEKVRSFFQSNKIDAVIHGAARPGHRNAQDPTNLVYHNLRMFYSIIRNSHLYGKLIFLSSGAVYDMRHYQPKMPEGYFDKHMPVDENGFSKYICANHIAQSDNAVELRIFGVFGKYEDYAIRFISNAICKTLFDLPVTIKQNRFFDYVYINDLEPVINYFLEKDVEHAAYNLTPDNSVDLYFLAETIMSISGKDLPIIVGKQGLGLEYSGDNGRLRREIPDVTFTPVTNAIQELYEWYAHNINMLNKDFLLVDK